VKVLLLAAGVGKRMRPLTLTAPKPMLLVKGKPLIEYHVDALVKAGYRDLVINLHYLGNQIEEFLGSGNKFGASIVYSREAELLETAGGILNALSLLGNEPFMVVNSDIFTDFNFATLRDRFSADIPDSKTMGHLVLVDNPLEHPHGDFSLSSSQREGFYLLEDKPGRKLTFSGISVFRPELFAGLKPGPSKLLDLLVPAIKNQRITAEHYRGDWVDTGTPDRLQALNEDTRR
jgi:MurNAc alpha-1-phosphate uridylyltransferase